MSRRAFLTGAAGAALLAACGGGDATFEPGTSEPEDGGPRSLGFGFADGISSDAVLVAGLAQRAPLLVVDGLGPVRGDSAPSSIEVEVLHKGSVVHSQTIAKHADGIPTPYYPLAFTPVEAGDYQVRASFAAGARPFKVTDRTQVNLVQVGDRLRPVVTPTTADARGVSPICTRSPAACPFHGVTLADAIAAGKPVAFIISTPGFCQTAICGPVLELLIDASKTSPVQGVHAEVYVSPNSKDANSRKTTEAVSVYALSYEPTLFVTNAGGIVTARLDFSWDRAELATALATAT
jgi:hypothetical protein